MIRKRPSFKDKEERGSCPFTTFVRGMKPDGEEGRKKVRVGITCGDPNGIGPEVILKCFQDPAVLENCDPVLYGSLEVLLHYREMLALEGPELHGIETPEASTPGRMAICNTWEGSFQLKPGEPDAQAGAFAFKALERASSDIREGKLDALLTAPLNKHSVRSTGMEFPGHTEYLTACSKADDALMFMLSERLRVGLVTGHIPLKDVARAIDKEKLLRKLRILKESLVRDFRIENPSIAVTGLNPHAGESGMLGTEEKELIAPALERARTASRIDCSGPFPADGLFGSNELQEYDAVLAMYHDQGLTPFKALTFEQGVNFTAGLPFVRTSPDHGTAFSIAGLGKASPASFRNALYTAIYLYRNRELQEGITSSHL